MAESDWNITLDGGGGADVLEQAAFQNSLVSPELPRPVSDVWCRRIHNDSGSARGHCAFLYSRVGEVPVVSEDVSISMAIALSPRSTGGEHSFGVGCRLSSSVVAGTANAPDYFCQNGYHLMLVAGTANYTIKLVRVVSGVPTTLWSDTRTGVVDTYKWLHIRLDMMIQPNDDLLFQVFENDLTTNDVDSPVWVQTTSVTDLAATAYDGAAGLGFGGQCKAGSDYDAYVDWAVLQKG